MNYISINVGIQVQVQKITLINHYLTNQHIQNQ